MNGVILINKPKGCTSHDIVYKLKKILNEKVGHTGTLDPMATGVLPLLLGEGTKLSEYLTNHDKVYEAILKLGIKTDTADTEGNIIEEKEVNLNNLESKNVLKVLNSFVGKQMQTPPIYSAIKVNGKKLYEYARSGKQVQIPQREIEIYSMDLLQIKPEEKTITFKVQCSKGTYIRTLCEQIAEKLETVGYMQNLKRLKVGSFDIDNSVTIEELEKNKDNKEFLEKHIITVKKFFESYPVIKLNNEELRLFLNGVKLKKDALQDGIYQIKLENEKWIGTGIITNNLLKRKLIIS